MSIVKLKKENNPSKKSGLLVGNLVYKPFSKKKKIKFHIGYNQVKFPNKSLLFKNIKALYNRGLFIYIEYSCII